MFDFIRKPLLWHAWDKGLDDEIDRGDEFRLKLIQDLGIFLHLREMTGKRIAEVGGGYSRLLPVLSKANDCANVEKWGGEGLGPTRERVLPNVQNIHAYLGENDSALADASFDVIFSISVVEHISPKKLDAFHEDQKRILKPGGMFIHAIDLYVEDEPSVNHAARFNVYRNWVTSTPGVTPVGAVYEGPCRFTCDLATNPDNVMYQRGKLAEKLAPARSELPKVAQSVSVLVAGRKRR